MTVALTDEQRAAVERRDGPLFVTAGAGSGKTRVLVERFVAAAVEDGVAVDRLLAITFTEKAAAEMRARVRGRLLELGRRELAREAEAASISTIHGFCSSLLRANALAAGLDPDYSVLDEAAAGRLVLDAFDHALEAFLDEARGSAALDLAAAYGTDKLRQMVVTVHGRLRSLGRRPELEPVAPPSPAGERERFVAAVAAARRELGPQAGGGVTIDRVLGALERCDSFLAGLGDGDGDPAELAEVAVRTGKARAVQTPAFEELAAAHGAYLAYCEGKRAAADHALLARLLALFRDRYAELKDARSALDFDDLELRARDLLTGRPAVREAVRERYAQVMVDEFQDTNPLQNEILDLVSADNLFAVGDEDQSIYGFRHADVALFRRRRASAEADNRAVALRTNFRARPELLEVINSAFGSVWGERGFEPLRAADSATPAAPPRVEPVAELLVVDSARGRWEEALGAEAPLGETLAGVPPWRAAEARVLARRISELAGPDRPFDYGDVAVLLRAGTDMAAYERAIAELGIPTYAHGSGGWWEAQQVLDLRSYLAALANPRDELALVMVLASPLVGASLGVIATVRLRARALGRTLWWALEQAFADGGDGSGGLADALEADPRARLERFVVRLAAERSRAPRLSLEALIDRAATDTGYDLEVLALPAGERRLANVRKLMRLARAFESEHGRDVRGFIDHLDERRLLGGREGEAPVEGETREPAVRLMTIHAAKGLEFPVVCVADLGRTQVRDSGSALELSDDGRFGLRLASLSGATRATFDMERLQEEQRARADEEEKRIFHVAMTRAREHLVLSGALDPERWPEPKPLGAPIDWMWRAVAPGAKNLLSDALVGVDSGVRCELVVPSAVAGGSCGFGASAPPTSDGRRPEASSAPPARAAESGARDSALAPARFASVPAARSLPVARLSYSALESYKRCGYRFYLERVAGLRGPDPAAAVRLAPPARNGQLVLRLEEPPVEETAVGVTPLLRGTIVHQLLERFDFERPEPPAAEEVERLLEGHGAPVTGEEVERVRGLIGGFARSALRERAAAGGRLRRELPFAFELRPDPSDERSILVNGVVDVHVEEDGGVLVIDYKTDPLEDGDPAEVVAERYATQRLVYALAALRSGAPRVDVAYSFLEAPAAPVEARFAANEAGELEARLLELARGVVEGRFEPTAEPHRELCLTCPGRAALCSWGPERTLREHPTAAIPS